MTYTHWSTAPYQDPLSLSGKMRPEIPSPYFHTYMVRHIRGSNTFYVSVSDIESGTSKIPQFRPSIRFNCSPYDLRFHRRPMRSETMSRNSAEDASCCVYLDHEPHWIPACHSRHHTHRPASHDLNRPSAACSFFAAQRPTTGIT